MHLFWGGIQTIAGVYTEDWKPILKETSAPHVHSNTVRIDQDIGTM